MGFETLQVMMCIVFSVKYTFTLLRKKNVHPTDSYWIWSEFDNINDEFNQI